MRCIPLDPVSSHTGSYESLAGKNTDLEMNMATPMKMSDSTEKTPLELARLRRKSMKKLKRQPSVMDTQKTRNGGMQLTYWF